MARDEHETILPPPPRECPPEHCERAGEQLPLPVRRWPSMREWARDMREQAAQWLREWRAADSLARLRRAGR